MINIQNTASDYTFSCNNGEHIMAEVLPKGWRLYFPLFKQKYLYTKDNSYVYDETNLLMRFKTEFISNNSHYKSHFHIDHDFSENYHTINLLPACPHCGKSFTNKDEIALSKYLDKIKTDSKYAKDILILLDKDNEERIHQKQNQSVNKLNIQMNTKNISITPSPEQLIALDISASMSDFDINVMIGFLEQFNHPMNIALFDFELVNKFTNIHPKQIKDKITKIFNNTQRGGTNLGCLVPELDNYQNIIVLTDGEYGQFSQENNPKFKFLLQKELFLRADI